MNWILFLTLLINVESSGNINAVGGLNTKYPSYGLCQIQQNYLDDVNKIAHTSYTMAQVKSSRALSEWCVKTYVTYYGNQYTKATGKPLTMEVAARIHNGGPQGYRYKSTVKYWKKYQKQLARMKQ